MNNLNLITTEKFCDVDCNFYKNENNEVLLTREQIGQALEYTNPIDGIYRIHKRHKDRLDKLSIGLSDGLGHEIYYYTQRGVMELCRWSRQPLANKFMDWTWDIIEKYRSHQQNESLYYPKIQSELQELTNTVQSLQKEIIDLKSHLTLAANTNKQESTALIRDPTWFYEMNPKYKLIMDYKNCTRNELYASIYAEIEQQCNVNLTTLHFDYCKNNNLSVKQYYLMNLIEDTPKFKETLENYINEQLELFDLK